MHPAPAISTCLPQTTVSGVATLSELDLQDAIHARDPHLIMEAVMEGAALHKEAFGWSVVDECDYSGLTAMALAVLLDSRHEGVCAVSTLLSAGGRLDTVDARGRTLLHFATSAPVARFLVEHGVPLPQGARERWLRALAAPPGRVLFDEGVPLAMPDNDGALPWMAVQLTHAGFAYKPWRSVVTLSEADIAYVSHRRQWGIGNVRALWPQTVYALSAADELAMHLVDGELKHAAQLIGLGAEQNLPQTDLFIEADDGDREYLDLTALGVATVLDSVDGTIHRLALFDASQLGGFHGKYRSTLLHLATAPVVARWLLDHGAPFDVKDSSGRLPEETLPPATAALVVAHRLSRVLPDSAGTSRPGGRL
ncbi:hypothetical protein ABIE56_000341 [Luteibacter sp. 621]|uniref:hypothetical protein n=1 Tax=Luteibacter sp. 621 TaxID=3373916 RepID=UPI003D1A5650